MASILSTIGAALINAGSFVGFGKLSSMLSDHGAKERKRHDLATEEETKANHEWYRKRAERLNFINKELREQQKATKNIKDLEVGMETYYRFSGRRLKPLERKPKLTDFYHPSEQQKNGEILFIVVGTALSSYLIFKYIKWTSRKKN